MVNRTTQPQGSQLLLEGVQANEKLPDTQRWQEIVVKLSDIRNMPKPDELRRNPEEMEQFTGTMAHGQEERIVVSLTKDGGWNIEHGKHRCEALRRLKRTDVKAKFRADLTPEQAAMARCIGNDQQAPSTPYQAALDYEVLRKGGATIARIAEMVGKSEATVSFRLSLLKLASNVAMRVGRDITNDAAVVLVGLQEHPKLLERAQAALPSPKQLAKDRRAYLDEYHVRSAVRTALTTGKDAPAVSLQDESLGDHWDRQDPTLRVKIAQLPKVQVGHEVLYLEPAKVRGLVEEARERRLKREKSTTRADTTPERKADLRRARLARLTRARQLEMMVKHVKSRTSFGPDLLKGLIRHLVKRAHNCAQAKADLQGVLDATGLSSVKFGNADFVDKLWAKDRLAAERLAVCVLFLESRDWNGKGVRDDAVAQLATGTTFKAAEASARKAMDAKDDVKVAKPAKAKAKKPAPTPARKTVAKPIRRKAKTPPMAGTSTEVPTSLTSPPVTSPMIPAAPGDAETTEAA